jgi:hypothetical protein
MGSEVRRDVGSKNESFFEDILVRVPNGSRRERKAQPKQACLEDSKQRLEDERLKDERLKDERLRQNSLSGNKETGNFPSSRVREKR